MDVRDVLTRLDIPFKEHGESSLVSQGWLGIECPRCGRGTGKTGLGINLRSLAVSCWKCGKASLLSVLVESSNKPVAEVRRVLGAMDAEGDVPLAPYRAAGRYKEPSGVGELQPVHRRYLERRGFDPDEIAERWGVRGIGVGGQYQFRLFLPVFADRKPASWTTRAVGDVSLRYVSAPPTDESVHLKSLLYGEHLAQNAVVVVEGPTDAWRIGPGAVATFGLTYTPAQVARIATYPVRVVCFDNEPTAQRRARALADELAPFPGATYVVALSGPDPDSSPGEEIDELRKTFLD